MDNQSIIQPLFSHSLTNTYHYLFEPFSYYTSKTGVIYEHKNTHHHLREPKSNYSRNAALGDISDSCSQVLFPGYLTTTIKQVVNSTLTEPQISDFSEINGTSTKMRGKCQRQVLNFVYLVRMHPKPRPVSNYSPSTYRYNKSCHLPRMKMI